MVLGETPAIPDSLDFVQCFATLNRLQGVILGLAMGKSLGSCADYSVNVTMGLDAGNSGELVG